MFDLRKKLQEEIIILDGATGTNLQKAGMPTGVCPELWILENPEVLLSLQQEYVKAGTQILYAPTFSGNPVKLEEYGVGDRLEEINGALVKLSRQAAGEHCLVAGDLTMTGRALTPVGDMDFEELVDCYKQQVNAIAKAGVDLFVIETMMSVQECRAAVLAVKETTDLPVFVTITLEESGRTLYGTDPVTALITLQSLGVDAFGLNCSTGPDKMIPLIQELSQYAQIPLIVKPNAGLPKLTEEGTVFDMSEEEFAQGMKTLVEAGASVVGGCCGTNPSYIRALCQQLPDRKRIKKEISQETRRILTSDRRYLEFTLDSPLQIVGERINPTGKKKLQRELVEGSLELVAEMAQEQAACGATILDVNVGMSGICEEEMMIKVIEKVGQCTDLPLCIDSSDPKVVAAALRRYPGRALVNSISCEKVKIEELLPEVKKYGAMFILLPLTDERMPRNQEERWENIQYVLEKAQSLGLKKEDAVVDGLVASVAADPNAAKDTLATIERCYKEGLATICGLSNISFGLPDRTKVNSVFLSMAVDRGLTMAISNPSQALFRQSCLAADLLLGKEGAAIEYVEYCSELQEQAQAIQSTKEMAGTSDITQKSAGNGSKTSASLSKSDGQVQATSGDVQELDLTALITTDILKGKIKDIEEHIPQALEQGMAADFILNKILIPAINEVGELFNQQKYFLPQLIISARAMETGVAILEPILREKNTGPKGPGVVIATVKGDIHDIGKNLVAMMMKNYGFDVIDLGKDVDKESMLATAKEHDAKVIAMSALMTTTMSYMKEVIDFVRNDGADIKLIVGGAAVTEEYAMEIGADGYAKDAVDSVEMVKKLLSL